ncbi:MAG: N-acetylmuramic acid 6-phosphate etherase [Fidelibacterota bacterium]
MSRIERKDLNTEQQNTSSLDIDSKSIPEILEIINREDQSIPHKVREAIPEIAQTIELTTGALHTGHRIVYLGAGTSGRLGVLDASEIPPTFSAPSEWFKGIIAGGDEALQRSIEGAEDIPENGERDLRSFGLEAGDVVIGISTSGAAAYVRAGLDYAQSIGAKSIYLICNPKPYFSACTDVVIRVDVGPEIVTGSTRMKSGTATKLVLNMISTATMVRLGKVYGNLMVDLMAVNNKLVDRGTRIISQLTGLGYDTARDKLFSANKSVKTAIVMIKKNCDLKTAEKLLEQADGFLRSVID